MKDNSKIIVLYKNLGETPLECLYRFKSEHLEYEGENMTYLGRLDPMAEGIMPVLVGNTRDKSKYLSLDKTYEFEVLWGFESDTHDVLGIPYSTNLKSPFSVSARISAVDFKFLAQIRNKTSQQYPIFSSRTVGGKPLFQWARENKINEIEVPEKGIKIFSIEHIHTRLVKGEEILKEVSEKITLVKGDFRQKEIIKAWNKVLKDHLEEQFFISKFTADVSSGTYIRGLAHEMGRMLDTNALAYSIKRTRVGDYFKSFL